jgi:hypothetical protein
MRNGGAVLLSSALGDQECGAVVGGLGLAAVADAGVRRHGFPDAFQGHTAGDVEVAGEEERPTPGGDHTAVLSRGIERLLEGGGVVGPAITLGAEVAHGQDLGSSRSGRRGDPQWCREEKYQAKSNPESPR